MDDVTRHKENGDFNPLNKPEPEEQPQNTPPELFSDGIFSMKISEDMTIRNILRSGLVEAQGRDSDKVPMFVSWPHWLDDGIVCLFAQDLHDLLDQTIKKTALSVGKAFDMQGDDDERLETKTGAEQPQDFQPIPLERLETVSSQESPPRKGKSKDIVTEIYSEGERVDKKKESVGRDSLSEGPSDQNIADTFLSRLKGKKK